MVDRGYCSRPLVQGLGYGRLARAGPLPTTAVAVAVAVAVTDKVADAAAV